MMSAVRAERGRRRREANAWARAIARGFGLCPADRTAQCVVKWSGRTAAGGALWLANGDRVWFLACARWSTGHVTVFTRTGYVMLFLPSEIVAGRPTTRVAEGLECPLCAEHAAEIDAEREGN